MIRPYEIAKDVFIEFQDSSTLVDFMVMDMDPRQQTAIIPGKPFLKLVNVTIDKTSSTRKLMGFMRSSSTTPRTSHATTRFQSTDSRAREG
jgi:hypothetical protein